MKENAEPRAPSSVSPLQFGLFRVLVGAGFAIHFFRAARTLVSNDIPASSQTLSLALVVASGVAALCLVFAAERWRRTLSVTLGAGCLAEFLLSEAGDACPVALRLTLLAFIAGYSNRSSRWLNIAATIALAGWLAVQWVASLSDGTRLHLGWMWWVLWMVAWNRHWLPARRDLRTPVLLFDGECGLCDGVVRTLLREDQFGRIKFAALQSEPAQRFLAAHGLPATDFESLVFVRDCNDPAAGYSLRTTGVCDVLDEVGGICRILSWSRIIPRALRDVLYRGVARVRFAIFGRSNAAATASMAGPGRFLDR